MPKYLCTHTLPPGGVTRQQFNELAHAGQHDPTVRGYRSFANLTEGKVVCVFEGPNKDAVAAWFQKMKMPYDSITLLELEGEAGAVHQA